MASKMEWAGLVGLVLGSVCACQRRVQPTAEAHAAESVTQAGQSGGSGPIVSARPAMAVEVSGSGEVSVPASAGARSSPQLTAAGHSGAAARAEWRMMGYDEKSW